MLQGRSKRANRAALGQPRLSARPGCCFCRRCRRPSSGLTRAKVSQRCWPRGSALVMSCGLHRDIQGDEAGARARTHTHTHTQGQAQTCRRSRSGRSSRPCARRAWARSCPRGSARRSRRRGSTRRRGTRWPRWCPSRRSSPATACSLARSRRRGCCRCCPGTAAGAAPRSFRVAPRSGRIRARRSRAEQGFLGQRDSGVHAHSSSAFLPETPPRSLEPGVYDGRSLEREGETGPNAAWSSWAQGARPPAGGRESGPRRGGGCPRGSSSCRPGTALPPRKSSPGQKKLMCSGQRKLASRPLSPAPHPPAPPHRVGDVLGAEEVGRALQGGPALEVVACAAHAPRERTAASGG
jgi:hypothetical protein